MSVVFQLILVPALIVYFNPQNYTIQITLFSIRNDGQANVYPVKLLHPRNRSYRLQNSDPNAKRLQKI